MNIAKFCIAWAVTTMTKGRATHVHAPTNEYLPSASIPPYNFATFQRTSGWNSVRTSFEDAAFKTSIAWKGPRDEEKIAQCFVKKTRNSDDKRRKM